MAVCAEPGCPVLVDKGRCPAHAPQYTARIQRHYTGQPGVHYGRQWKKARAAYLLEHPLCVDCQQEGVIHIAEELDHILPHRGDAVLFWDKNNWAGRCKRHHSAKTARELHADQTRGVPGGRSDVRRTR